MPTLSEALKKRMETTATNVESAATKRKPVKKKSTKSRKRLSDKEKMAKLWATLEKKKEAFAKLKAEITALERTIRDSAFNAAAGIR